MIVVSLCSGPALNDDDDDEDDDDVKPGPSNGHTKAKTPQQRAGEQMARHLLEKVKGDNFSFRSARKHRNLFLQQCAYNQGKLCQMAKITQNNSMLGKVRIFENELKYQKNQGGSIWRKMMCSINIL